MKRAREATVVTLTILACLAGGVAVGAGLALLVAWAGPWCLIPLGLGILWGWVYMALGI